MKNKGYITLISVIIVGSIGIVIVVSMLLISIGSNLTNQYITDSHQARAYAATCLEEALMEIREDTGYSGVSTQTFGSNECGYEVIDNGGENRTVETYGNFNNSVQRIQVQVDQINPTINISSYKPVADF